MSFAVDIHYCGDTLIDIAVFKEAKSCGMGMAMERSSSSEVKKKGCCHDEQIIVKGQDELKTPFQNIDLEQQDFVVPLYTSYIYLFEDSEVHSIPFNGYPPPDIVTDFIVLHEQFLI
jgi:hypothetical protein